MPRRQYAQRPHLVIAGTSTRSPTPKPLTASPTAVIVPTASWPRIRPSVTAATSPCRMCRSVPQIVVVSTRTTTSVGSWTVASGTSSQALLPGPWYTNAFIGTSVVASSATLVAPVTRGCPRIGRSARAAEARGGRPTRIRDTRRAAAPPVRSPPAGIQVVGVAGAPVGGVGAGWAFASATRVAVTVAPLRGPVTRTVVPTGNCAAVAGAVFVPNTVCGPSVTVNALPLAVVTVQVVAVSAVIWPRTPCSTGAREGAGVGAAARGGAALLQPATAAPTTASAPASIRTRMPPSWRRHVRIRSRRGSPAARMRADDRDPTHAQPVLHGGVDGEPRRRDPLHHARVVVDHGVVRHPAAQEAVAVERGVAVDVGQHE